MRTILVNGRIITPYRTIAKGSVIIEGRKITGVLEGIPPNGDTDLIIDVQGNYISPGFIDLHTHGAGGHDFMDSTVEAFKEASLTHLRFGTTSLVPTTLTSSMAGLYNTFDAFREAKASVVAPNLLGMHIEGPYLSPEQRGAQDPKYIKNPDFHEYSEILNYTKDIVRWTIAPELPGALEMGRILSEQGILCSIGHSNATYEEVLKGFEAGFTHITHLYSAMSTVHRKNANRYAGVVESAFLIDDMTVEIIADGIHLPGSLLQLVYKIKGAGHICLVTDSMRAAGQAPGESILGSKNEGQKVIVEDGVAKLLDRTAFAGSVCTADRLIRTMVDLGRVPLEKAIEMVTLTPAKTLNIQAYKGSLTPGKDADLAVFDEDIKINLVIVGGKTCYRRGNDD